MCQHSSDQAFWVWWRQLSRVDTEGLIHSLTFAALSFQLTCLKRPLVVIHELFDKSIMDISW